jgi:TonB-dependent receptor
VLKRISGVTVQEDKYVIVRGLNERYNINYLNGAPLPGSEPDKKAFAFDIFPSALLDNLVVYKTATPDLPSEFAGGIIQVSTKSIPEKNFISINAGGGYNTLSTGKTRSIYPGGKLDEFGFDDHSRDLPEEIPGTYDKNSWITNQDQARMARNFKNDWSYSQGITKPNTNFQLSGGYNLKRKDRDFLGVIFGLGYNTVKNSYSLERNEYESMFINGGDATPQKEQYFLQHIDQSIATSAALLNIGMKLNGNNSISVKNMLSGVTDNKFIQSTGTANVNEENITITRNNSRYFSANKIITSQVSGDHNIEPLKLKLNWVTGLSLVDRNVPDLRFSVYNRLQNIRSSDGSEPDPTDTVYKAQIGNSTGPDYAGYRVYSKLNEKMISQKADLTRSFKISAVHEAILKFGGSYQQRERQFNIRQFGMQPYSMSSLNYNLLMLPEDSLFNASHMGPGGFKIYEATRIDDNYHALSNLTALYGMGEWKAGEKLRVIGGLRYEKYRQNVTISWPRHDSVYVENTIADLLPSVNLIYNVTPEIAVRLAWYKTLNRAEFRELAATNWYDPETRLSVAGNPGLKRCFIRNYDLRLEFYPGRGQLVTVSGFYKYFNAPIERYMWKGSENQIYYQNANYANVYGTELEYRINAGALFKKDSSEFLNNLTLFSNLSLIRSVVNVEGINENVAKTRTMQGQAPYIINAGITYSDRKNGYSITGMVNRVGDRINLVGNDQVPDRWEKARTIVDLQLTKSFMKNKLELKFNIKDLLHQSWIVYYKGNDRKSNAYDAKKDNINFLRNYGSVYSILLSYTF